MQHPDVFDVIVVGGGHAGTEAACAAARMGARTVLVTQSVDTLGQMSCNPAIGGIGKGHLVREIDALGGVMARGADACGIHFRVLNGSKGAAVRATRAQIDRTLYRAFVRREIESLPGLQVFQQPVQELIIASDGIQGVVTQLGVRLEAASVVLTTGTFLAGQVHVGESSYGAGRAGEPPARALAACLRALPLRVGRLKTGTPPRLDGRTIDYSVLGRQPGDAPLPVFSFLGRPADHPRQVECHITHTNERTHEIIRRALVRSPLYSGRIAGVGPRYCPSVEDKVVRFAEKASHQIFVEPEGLDTSEVYPNGISTSLPFDVQLELVRSIRGFERAHITRPGYAIEYDYLDPRDLHCSLESRIIPGLFLAGQINGTTGYEEAAAQGLLAGINAVRRLRSESAWWPRRDEAYLGVLVDDLVTRGTNEPYRMFTSRAEYRLQLREDNADLRLTPLGRSFGLVDEARWARFEQKRARIDHVEALAARVRCTPGAVAADDCERLLGAPLTRDVSVAELLRRPAARLRALLSLSGTDPGFDDPEVDEQVEIRARYAGYLERQLDEIARLRRHEETPLPADIDYADVVGLSAEVRQKLADYRPASIGQAARISGITPAAVSLLLVHLRRSGSRGGAPEAA